MSGGVKTPNHPKTHHQAQWNVQVVRGKVTTRCLWNACKALSVGLLLLAIGTTMAVIGYYADQLSIRSETRGNSTVKIKNETRGFHLNNLSYAGPIVMGIGGFIVVAACVMTFEARDSAAKVVPARFKPNLSASVTGESPKTTPKTSRTFQRMESKRSASVQTPSGSRGPGKVESTGGDSDWSPKNDSVGRRAFTAAFVQFSRELMENSTYDSNRCWRGKVSEVNLNKSPSAPDLTGDNSGSVALAREDSVSKSGGKQCKKSPKKTNKSQREFVRPMAPPRLSDPGLTRPPPFGFRVDPPATCQCRAYTDIAAVHHEQLQRHCLWCPAVSQFAVFCFSTASALMKAIAGPVPFAPSLLVLLLQEDRVRVSLKRGPAPIVAGNQRDQRQKTQVAIDHPAKLVRRIVDSSTRNFLKTDLIFRFLQRQALSMDNPFYDNFETYTPPCMRLSRQQSKRSASSRESFEMELGSSAGVSGSLTSMALDLHDCQVTLRVKDEAANKRSDTARRHQLLRQKPVDDDIIPRCVHVPRFLCTHTGEECRIRTKSSMNLRSPCHHCPRAIRSHVPDFRSQSFSYTCVLNDPKKCTHHEFNPKVFCIEDHRRVNLSSENVKHCCKRHSPGPSPKAECRVLIQEGTDCLIHGANNPKRRKRPDKIEGSLSAEEQHPPVARRKEHARSASFSPTRKRKPSREGRSSPGSVVGVSEAEPS